MCLSIIPCRPEEIALVRAVISEAREWLLSRGSDQWRNPYPDHLIAQEIERGEVHLVYLDGELAGTITLQWADPRSWGEMPERAGYVHRLTVLRAFAGRELGRRMLDWAEETSRAVGKNYLRLDCVAKVSPLCEYYRNAGFVTRGTVQLEGEHRVRLWEKAL